ncbi:hypothetical protein HCN51_29425 [Nonomuraea sp. FMUSA5-5]|uniref:DUF998 domain-containing protein n=1 Tax=Nonomuraea composti TaxID=2720023 RepID=A0ABX1B6T7_9ACTN|nr:hypothetical protein [Nonomuraea sp. FMUSA5-5]NJP93520.1 hypothetical protein [Nonomuraea sp. FMUSA5-5]
MTRNIRTSGALLSIAVTAVGVLWWTTPASYPFGAADRVKVSLTHLLEHDVTGPMTVAAGLVGLVVIFGRGPVVRAGAVAELLFFGVVLSDAGIMSVFAYGLAILGPVALLGVVVVAAARGKAFGLVGVATLGVLAAADTITGFGALSLVGRYLGNVASDFASFGGRLGWTLANAAACAVWAVIAAKAFRTGERPRWIRPDSARRWGRIATIGAALCPLPYALYRLTWLTPWPTDADVTGALRADTRLQGLLLAFAALAGAALTLGLISRWGEVFPRWVPIVHGRPVPVGLPVIAGGTVAGLCCLASPGLVIDSVLRGQPGALLLWPYPLWGALLAVAVLAYWLRRRAVPAGR